MAHDIFRIFLLVCPSFPVKRMNVRMKKKIDPVKKLISQIVFIGQFLVSSAT
jgi:hypothetical protein